MKLRLALLAGAAVGAVLGALIVAQDHLSAQAPAPDRAAHFAGSLPTESPRPERPAPDQPITHSLNSSLTSSLPVTVAVPANSSGTTVTYTTIATTSSGRVLTYVVNGNPNGEFVSIQPAAPHLSIACDGDTCEARGASLEQMRTLLHRIADKTVTIEMHAVDPHGDCRQLHETIPAESPAIAERAPPYAVTASATP